LGTVLIGLLSTFGLIFNLIYRLTSGTADGVVIGVLPFLVGSAVVVLLFYAIYTETSTYLLPYIIVEVDDGCHTN
jgi:hypothetical protein